MRGHAARKRCGMRDVSDIGQSAGGQPAGLHCACAGPCIVMAKRLAVIGFSFQKQPTEPQAPWRFSSGDAVQAALIKSRGRRRESATPFSISNFQAGFVKKNRQCRSF